MVTSRFDMTKAEAKKVASQVVPGSAQGRFGSAETVDRREQRKRDQELGLIPFACKLPTTLVEQLREQSTTHDGGINALVAELLTASLKQRQGSAD